MGQRKDFSLPVWKKPELWRDGVHPFPLVHAQSTEPELAPGGDPLGAVVGVEELSRTLDALVLTLQAQQSESDVIGRRAKDGRPVLYVESPAPILVLDVGQIPYHLFLPLLSQLRLGHVACDHQTWQEE